MNSTMTPPPTRKLTRSNRDSKVAGVAGGLGEYFGVDPVIFRLAFVVAFFAGGTGLLAYIIAWLVLPESDGADAGVRAPSGTWSPPVIIGALLVVAGVVSLIDSSSWFGLDINGPIFIWPVGLLIAGGFLILKDRDEPTHDTGAENGRAGETEPPTVPDPLASSAVAVYGDADTVDADTVDAENVGDETVGDDDLVGPAAVAPVAPSRAARFSPTRLAFGGLLIFFGVIGLAFLFDWFDVSVTATLAIALVIVGVGLVAGAIWGGGWALVPVGLVLGLLLTASAAAGDIDISGGVGENVVRPAGTAATGDQAYQWGIGSMRIDLRDIDPATAPALTTVTAEQGIGELEIIVPDDVGIIINADVGMGDIDIDLPSEDVLIDEDGISQDERVERRDADEPTIEIFADLGIGRLHVHEG